MERVLKRYSAAQLSRQSKVAIAKHEVVSLVLRGLRARA